jgi:hypothetical protein
MLPRAPSQMDMERKICDIRTWGTKLLFLDISSSSINKLVPSLYRCVEIRNVEVFCELLSQPLPHLRFNVFVICDTFAPKLRTALLPTVNSKHFFMNILCIESSCTQKRTADLCSSAVYSSSNVAIFTTEISL